MFANNDLIFYIIMEITIILIVNIVMIVPSYLIYQKLKYKLQFPDDQPDNQFEIKQEEDNLSNNGVVAGEDIGKGTLVYLNSDTNKVMGYTPYEWPMKIGYYIKQQNPIWISGIEPSVSGSCIFTASEGCFQNLHYQYSKQISLDLKQIDRDIDGNSLKLKLTYYQVIIYGIYELKNDNFYLHFNLPLGGLYASTTSTQKLKNIYHSFNHTGNYDLPEYYKYNSFPIARVTLKYKEDTGLKHLNIDDLRGMTNDNIEVR